MKFLLGIFFGLATFVQSGQGLEGFLREAKGNQMGIQKQSGIKGKALSSRIYLYKKLTKEDLLGLEGQWCKSVQQKPIKVIQADTMGYFKTNLVPGQYIVLVGVYDGYFIPSFNQFDQPGSITIKSGKWEQMNILVNSKAIY
jgi:hypothetical protein